MEGMTVKNRLVLGFSSVCIIIAIFSIYLLSMISHNKQGLELQSQRSHELLLVKTIIEANDSIGHHAMNLIIDKDTGVSRSDMDIILTKLDYIETNYKKLQDMCDTQEEKRLTQDVYTNLTKLKPMIKVDLVNLINQKASSEEFSKIDDSIDATSEDISKDLDKIANYIAKEMDSADKSARESMDSAYSLIIIMSIAIIVLMIIIGTTVIGSIQKVLTTTISNILDSSSEILNASSQITNSSVNLSEKSSVQSTVVEQVNASVEQSYSTIKLTTQNAKDADKLSKEANTSANGGYEHIKQLSKSMDDINTSSNRIANIIKTIDEIAFQTNLLALNAAVEAARAGEHGLGFAVVADEVRSLASRSASAAKETAYIIEESVQQVKNGNEITTLTNLSFEEILNNSKKTTDIISEIAASSNDQMQSIHQISTSLQIVDNSTQVIATSSEELTATAEELNQQAKMLRENIITASKQIGIDVHY